MNESDIDGYGDEKESNEDGKHSISQDDQNSAEISTSVQKSKDNSKEEIQGERDIRVSSKEKHSKEATENVTLDRKHAEQHKFADDVTDVSQKGSLTRRHYYIPTPGLINSLCVPPHVLSNLCQFNYVGTLPFLAYEATGPWLSRSNEGEGQDYTTSVSSSKQRPIVMPDFQQHRATSQVG